jgi:transposase
MAYTQAAVERAVKVHEVLMQALNGRQPWIHVAEVLGVSARTVQRLRRRYERNGFTGLYDHRHHRPSPRAVPVEEVQRLLTLYRERYGPRDGHPGFNIRHFYQIARREHQVTVSYSFVKKALQAAGLVTKRRARGKHRRRREPRPCLGELLHLDGSRHRWLALVPDALFTLIAVVDDATKRLLYAQLLEDSEGEGTPAVMTALREVLETYGIPGALYTDRAGWAAYTPTSGSAPDRTKLTQVGRALARLGIDHILGFSPQARGRSELANGTLRGRLVNELRVAEIRTVAAANHYLRERFLPDYNATFTHAPADPASAFVPIGRADLDQILCHEEERVVARDNTVSCDGLALQLDKQRGRRTVPGCECWCAAISMAVCRSGGGPGVWASTRRPAACCRSRNSPRGGGLHRAAPLGNMALCASSALVSGPPIARRLPARQIRRPRIPPTPATGLHVRPWSVAPFGVERTDHV